jgi:NTP pyrophosphatase (non-canonical NTP hydrolase)
MRTLREMQKAVYDNNVAHGWHEGAFTTTPESVITKLMLAVGELSEAVEEIRNGHPYDKVYFAEDGKKPEGFGIEMADAVIRLLDVAEMLGIDMQDAIILKHNYNVTRPYKHGGKKL